MLEQDSWKPAGKGSSENRLSHFFFLTNNGAPLPAPPPPVWQAALPPRVLEDAV